MFTRDGLSHLWNEMVKDGELNHRLNMDINNRYMVTICIGDQATDHLLPHFKMALCVIFNDSMLKLS